MGALCNHCRVLRNVTEPLWNVMEELWDVTEHYASVTDGLGEKPVPRVLTLY